ncbi:MAG: AI-2E family transporter [Phycisphaerae bacterium]
MKQQDRSQPKDDLVSPREPATTLTLRLVVLGLLLIGCILVLRPFISAILWAIVLCISIWPLYSRLVNLLRECRGLGALILTICVILVLLTPFALIGLSLADDVRRFGSGLREVLESPPPEPPSWVEGLPLIGVHAGDTWRDLASDSAKFASRLKPLVEPVTSALLAGTVQFMKGVGELALSIFIAFFLFRDGPAVAQRFVEATEHIAGSQTRELVEVAVKTVRGVVYGILGTALAQSVIAGIGFLIAGVPGAALLALLTFFLSVVPMGPPLVWIPVAIWLFWKGSVGWGVFMVCWGLLVSSVDNVIKPVIISQGSRMPFVLVLLGVLGGAIAFGFIGVFLGPVLLVVGLRVLEHWNTAQLALRRTKKP